MDCIFCKGIKNENVLFETNFFRAVFDIDPVQDGHLLIMTKRHVLNIHQLTPVEELELLSIQKKIIKSMESTLKIDGVTLVLNNGDIMDEGTHFHLHFIPRYHSDEFWDHLMVKERPIDKHKFIERLKGEFQ